MNGRGRLSETPGRSWKQYNLMLTKWVLMNHNGDAFMGHRTPQETTNGASLRRDYMSTDEADEQPAYPYMNGRNRSRPGVTLALTVLRLYHKKEAL